MVYLYWQSGKRKLNVKKKWTVTMAKLSKKAIYRIVMFAIAATDQYF
jgi:hypothetical protein